MVDKMYGKKYNRLFQKITFFLMFLFLNQVLILEGYGKPLNQNKGKRNKICRTS